LWGWRIFCARTAFYLNQSCARPTLRRDFTQLRPIAATAGLGLAVVELVYASQRLSLGRIIITWLGHGWKRWFRRPVFIAVDVTGQNLGGHGVT
jgi:hypothetical protein